MEFCGGQATSTDIGGARGAEALRVAREEIPGAESGKRREVCSGRMAACSRSLAGSALGEFGDRCRVPVHTPQRLGASRIGVRGPIRVDASVPASALAGAWLQQSAVQWHSPGQQQ